MVMLTSKEIGEILRELRKRRGLTQEQLAEIVDVTNRQIQKYECGYNRMNTDMLQAIAHALAVPISSFFGDATNDERLLSEQELKLIISLRTLPNSDVREFIINCLLK